ncbi:RNA polymerase sigma24 factor [Actinorhabdospora filicis]|uniref:RNA polymerase sigma24 factor n=1 Tax=Actinorhabdospora filicis TaxID=1785913 RepID=A0A9W6SRG9_9ACTN|nr:SigE family RNA polymerase sigma factor [Actinorhabdospora filicis]GLZ81003.1 RNA polymerase sigma24 factor [Actinorhabdospora filicis]
MRHTAQIEDEYREFAATRATRLRDFAYLLCGDWHRAEDAVQTTLTKLYVRWPKTLRISADAYARKIVLNCLRDDWRSAWFRREKSAGDEMPDRAVQDPADGHADRAAVLSALASLSRRQRAVVVLRYWEDRSIEQTAEILGCSIGTVKSHTARGLQALRGLLDINTSTQAEGARR